MEINFFTISGLNPEMVGDFARETAQTFAGDGITLCELSALYREYKRAESMVDEEKILVHLALVSTKAIGKGWKKTSEFFQLLNRAVKGELGGESLSFPDRLRAACLVAEATVGWSAGTLK